MTRRKKWIIAVVGLCVVSLVVFIAIGLREPKVWRTIISIGGGDVVATFNDNGLARVRADGALIWEVKTDHVRGISMPDLQLFPDGLVAITGTLEDKTSVVDGVDLRTGARLWRVGTRGFSSLGAVAADGGRKYVLSYTTRLECDLSSFDEETQSGWSMPIADPNLWLSSKLWAGPNGVILLGSHGAFIVNATDGARQHSWSACGRVVKVEDRLIWLAFPSSAPEWPGKVEAQTRIDPESYVLLSWTSGSSEVEVLGYLPRYASLLAVGRYSNHWVASASIVDPSAAAINVSIFGIPVKDSPLQGWRVDLPVGELYSPWATLNSWVSLDHPSDGSLTRHIPVHSVDKQLSVHLRWIDLEAGQVTEEKVFESPAQLEVRRDGTRLVVVTSNTFELYDADAQLVVSHPVSPQLVYDFQGNRAALAGDALWFVDDYENLVREVLGAPAIGK